MNRTLLWVGAGLVVWWYLFGRRSGAPGVTLKLEADLRPGGRPIPICINGVENDAIVLAPHYQDTTAIGNGIDGAPTVDDIVAVNATAAASFSRAINFIPLQTNGPNSISDGDNVQLPNVGGGDIGPGLSPSIQGYSDTALTPQVMPGGLKSSF